MKIGKILLIILVVVVGLALFAVVGWLAKGCDVVKQETDPAVVLQKYMWFKDASAQLDKKIADIDVYQARLDSLTSSYSSIPRNQWSRTDQEDFNLWSSELAGIKASYNSLAAEYNAQMAKINWRFANIGELPEGATEALPREYKPYITE
jgi:hypothetical protein